MNELAVDVARSCRILERQGHEHSFLGHVSAREADGDSLLIKPSGIGLGEVEPRGLLEVDLSGVRLVGDGPVHSEVWIHTQLYRHRPDVEAVVHTHPLQVAALAASDASFARVNQDSVLFVDRLGWYEDPRLVASAAQGDALADALGDGRGALLRNHGLVTVGATVAEATFLAVALVNSLRVQLAARQLGELVEIPVEVAREMASHFEHGIDGRIAATWRYLNRMAEEGFA